MIEYIFVALVLLFLVTIYFWFDKDSITTESRLVRLINAKQIEIARLTEQNKELQHEIDELYWQQAVLHETIASYTKGESDD